MTAASNSSIIFFVSDVPFVPAKSTTVGSFKPISRLTLRPDSSSRRLANSIAPKCHFILRATFPHSYVYPDPIPEFADAETRKFGAELKKKLMEDRCKFGEDIDAVVMICEQILAEFLQKEYGGPGTLLVEPFTYMFVALNGKKLPGASLAARASLLWAQNNIDRDWQAWNLQRCK